MRNLLVMFVGGLAFAGCVTEAQTQTVTVTGQVIDLVCYARNKSNTGMDHDDGRACAVACIKWEGNPAGIVTSDGKVYQFAGGVVANNNAKAAAHIAQTVTVTGTVSVKDGMAMLTADDLTAAK